MKNICFLLTLAGLIWFQSCKEIGPQIDFGPTGDDTAYTAAPEAPQAKKVLAEEFTGVSCPPCPNGHVIMKSISDQLNGDLVVIAYHVFDFPQANPIVDGAHSSVQDFRTEDATEVGQSVYGGVGAMPLAGFDRTTIGTEMLLNLGQWSNAATSRAKLSTPVNIHITTTYDSTTREGTAIVRLAYTADVNTKQNLTVAITENGIIDLQKTNTPKIEVLEHYDHEHVLRDIVTPVVGIQVPEKVDPKVPGRVYERTFKFQVGEKWVARNCNVIAFVTENEAADRHVVQAEEVKLVP